MSLREELAERLYCAYYSTRPRPPLQDDLVMAAHKTFDPADPADSAWLAVADECIRQMIWTHISAKWANPESTGMLEIEEREDGPLNLTAAPEGWKP